MYCSHFNLQKKPFQLNSDNSFLWLGKPHARALDTLNQGIKGPGRFLVLTGDVGTGKTTLLHEIIQTLPPDTDCAHITDPSLELHYLFLAIAKGLGFESLYQEGEKFTPILMSALLRAEQQGKKAVVIIDEVHLVPDRFLARLISWARNSPGHTLTIILAGQLEFHGVIAKSLGSSWKDHVDVHAMLDPLDEEETLIYINQRLALAGARRRIFIVPAVHQAYMFSKGIPRLINIACDQAMITAFSKDMKIIDAPTFQEAVGILELPPVPQKKGANSIKKKSGRPGRLLAGLAAAVVLGIFVYSTVPQQSQKGTSQIAVPLPEPVQEESPAEIEQLQYKTLRITPETDNRETQLETAPIPPAIQPLNEEENITSLPLEKETQAEFYSPPEINESPIDYGHTSPPNPEPVNMKRFINEVFMIHEPAPHDSVLPEPGLTENAVDPEPPPQVPRQESEETPDRESQPPGESPEPDAIIDWLLKKKKP